MVTVLWYVLMVLEVLCSFLLIGVILLQRTKGQGVGLAFGAGLGESLFGARVGNVLTKTTVVLAIVFLVNTTILTVLGSGRRRPRSVVDKVKPLPAGSVTPAPFTPQMPESTPAATPLAAQPPVVQGEPEGVTVPPEDSTDVQNVPAAEPVQPPAAGDMTPPAAE